MLRPLGPVVVFGASNFPLAFSVAGGDTASAFAAGNPVIVKAHAAHPGTSELVGRIIAIACATAVCPKAFFLCSLIRALPSAQPWCSIRWSRPADSRVPLPPAARLLNLAAKRPEPIPFYGEMGSTNPMFILPGALAARGEKIAAELYGSFTLGAGQFCTKPGLVFLSEGKSAEDSDQCIAGKVAESPKFTLLTSGISSSYNREIRNRRNREGVALLAEEQVSRRRICFSSGRHAVPDRHHLVSCQPRSRERSLRPLNPADQLFKERTNPRRGSRSARSSHRHDSRHGAGYRRVLRAHRDPGK